MFLSIMIFESDVYAIEERINFYCIFIYFTKLSVNHPPYIQGLFYITYFLGSIYCTGTLKCVLTFLKYAL